MGKYRDWGEAAPGEGDLPIARDVTPNRHWTDSMREMAAHIGAYETMLIVDRFGGMPLLTTKNPELCGAWPLIGAEKTRILCKVYVREAIQVPVAHAAIRHAKMQGVVAAIRARRLTLSEAVMVLREGGVRTSTIRLNKLVNQTDEGLGIDPWTPRRSATDPAQTSIFDFLEEAA